MREYRNIGYIVEIYDPGSIRDVVAYFETSSPIVMNRGELIHQGFFKAASTKGLLRIVNIEHIIWEAEDRLVQKTCVMTEEADDTEEARFSKF